MPSKAERDYYRMGFKDGQQSVISEGPRILPSVGKAVGAYFKESKNIEEFRHSAILAEKEIIQILAQLAQ